MNDKIHVNELTEAILDCLYEFRGYDDWWDSLTAETYEDVVTALTRQLETMAVGRTVCS